MGEYCRQCGQHFLTFELYDDIVAECARALMATPADDTPLLSPEQRIVYADLLIAAYQRTAYVTLTLCVPFALLLRALFRRAGLTIADALVFSLFTIGHTAIVQAIIAPPLYRVVDADVATWVSNIPFVVILGQAAAGFSARRCDRF
jgi:hypothetical protein